MHGKQELMDLAEQILRAQKADGAEVVIIAEDSYLTRYANSTIHQNIAVSNIKIGLRLRKGKKAGIAWTNRADKDAILELVRAADALMREMPEDPEMPELYGPSEFDEIEGAYVERTAEFSPAERAKVLSEVIDAVKPFKAFGAFSTGTVEVVLMNTKGTVCYHRVTDAHLSVSALGDGGSGWAQASSRDVSEIDHLAVAKRARRKAELSRDPIEVEPGEFTVILEELAVATILSFMAYLGFSAKAFEEGKSFLKNKLGKKVFHESLTIHDDPFDMRGFPMAFDFEGVPKRKMVLVENGIAKGVVYDLRTAQKEGKESTGHAMMWFYSYPCPEHLVVKPGDRNLEDLIRETERGILVTRFHYTNVVEPLNLTLTGMTRDGTFLIEDGVLVKGIKNLRFTDSMVEVLTSIEGITRDLTLVSDPSWYNVRFPTGYLVPAIKVKKLSFTGRTEF